MPPFVLTVLKILLLVLLYFFIYRAVRSLTADLYVRRREGRREPKATTRRGEPRRVVLLDADGKKQATYALDGPLQIGRADSCEIRPKDTYLSHVHARLAPRGEGWVVEDLGSTNGTFLNQRKVQVPTPIAPGDRIRVGKSVLEVRG